MTIFSNNSISKEEFISVCNMFPPNAWTKLAFRYFCKNPKPKDKWFNKALVATLIILFILGMIGTMIDASHVFVGAVTIPFTILLFLVGFFTLPAFLMNNARIKKICKVLDITLDTYNMLADLYIFDE